MADSLGWYWAGMCGLLLIWAFFRLPEPKGRTYAEMDVLFYHKVPARKFASSNVDQFAVVGEHVSKGDRDHQV